MLSLDFLQPYVFAPPHGVVFAPHLGGAEKKFFATFSHFYLHLTPPPTFQILEISLVSTIESQDLEELILTLEPDPDHGPGAGTGFLSPTATQQREILLRRENPMHVLVFGARRSSNAWF